MLKKLSLTLSILLCLVCQAAAHAHLDTAEPKADSTVSKAPAAITLTFTQQLEAAFSAADVTGPAGNKVGQSSTVAGNRIEVKVGPLPQGTYTVKWHVMSVDSHKTEGTYQFTVKP